MNHGMFWVHWPSLVDTRDRSVTHTPHQGGVKLGGNNDKSDGGEVISQQGPTINEVVEHYKPQTL